MHVTACKKLAKLFADMRNKMLLEKRKFLDEWMQAAYLIHYNKLILLNYINK
jgi:hypothetical protein